MPWHNQIIKTPTGIYVPAHVADKLLAYHAPEDWPDTVGNFLGTPVCILPERTPQPQPHWWIRAWRWLTRRWSR
jgi:hypothetical protein